MRDMQFLTERLNRFSLLITLDNLGLEFSGIFFWHSLAEISIEQFGERIITVHTVEDASIYDLHHLYFDLKRLIMLMDGQFYPITSVTQDGVEITTSIQKKLLPNYFSADFMIGENNRLINFDEVLSETLFSNWCLIQEELDIVHNTALYCLSRVEMPVDMKCAFLIEAFIGVGEIIQSKKSEFVLPKRKSREESQLGLDLKYIISHYGQEIFRGEYQKDLEGFVQILVNSRNRIAHIKSKQNRKFLNGDESVLYLHKHRLTRAHREKQLKTSCQALHNAPPNRT